MITGSELQSILDEKQNIELEKQSLTVCLQNTLIKLDEAERRLLEFEQRTRNFEQRLIEYEDRLQGQEQELTLLLDMRKELETQRDELRRLFEESLRAAQSRIKRLTRQRNLLAVLAVVLVFI